MRQLLLITAALAALTACEDHMTNLTDNPGWPAVRCPDDGQEVWAQDGSAPERGPVKPGLQDCADRTALLLLQQVEQPLQVPWMRSVDGQHIEVGPIKGALFGDGQRLSAPATTITLDMTGFPDGFRYLYARAVGGILAFTQEYNLPPDDSLIFKAGDATRRYVGCFTTVGGTIVPFERRGRRYRYDGAQEVVTSAPGSYTPVALGDFVPPHSRLALLRLRQITSDAGPREMSLRRSGAPVVGAEFVLRANQAVTGGTNYASEPLEIGLDASQRIEYKVSGAGAGSATIAVAGFEE